MTKKTSVFDISSATGLRDLTDLKNTKGVRVLNEKEYFGIGGSEDGPVTFLYRTVDYDEADRPNVLLDDTAYRMPIC